ncbi:MAG: hypothetical protein Q4G58_12305 [bacterium]|nr:hypothetical protein [bacterium]
MEIDHSKSDDYAISHYNAATVYDVFEHALAEADRDAVAKVIIYKDIWK